MDQLLFDPSGYHDIRRESNKKRSMEYNQGTNNNQETNNNNNSKFLSQKIEQKSKEIYDPVKFFGHIDLITVSILGSFVTYKFITSVYEYLYEPVFDVFVDTRTTENYYLKLKNNYIKMASIVKAFVLWIFSIIILMIVYNMYHKWASRNKNNKQSTKQFSEQLTNEQTINKKQTNNNISFDQFNRTSRQNNYDYEYNYVYN